MNTNDFELLFVKFSRLPFSTCTNKIKERISVIYLLPKKRRLKFRARWKRIHIT